MKNQQQNVVVRRADLQDADHLTCILTESWSHAFAEILTVETLKKHTDYNTCLKLLTDVLEGGKGRFLISTLDNKPCGLLFWCSGEELPESAEIVAVHSLPFSWGSGVGKAMMEQAMEEITQGGFSSAYLWVFEQNSRARRFYEKCGFAVDGEKRISMYDNAPEVRYIKRNFQ